MMGINLFVGFLFKAAADGKIILESIVNSKYRSLGNLVKLREKCICVNFYMFFKPN